MDNVDISINVFAIPTTLSILAAILESTCLGLLIPLAQGIIQKDFNSLAIVVWMKKTAESYLEVQEVTNVVIFFALILLILMSSILKNIFLFYATYNVNKQIAIFGHRLRSFIFDKYLKAGKSFFDRNNFGCLDQVLLGFTNEIMIRLQNVNSLIFNIFILLGYVVMMFWISWKLCIISMIMFPLMNSTIIWVVRKIKITSEHEATAKTDLHKKITNNLFCIPLVKSYSREKQELEQFRQLSGTMEWLQTSIYKKISLISPLQEVLTMLGSLALIGIMAWLATKGGRDMIAGFVVFFILIRRAMMTVGGINLAKADLAVIEGAIHSIRHVVQQCEESEFYSGTRRFSGLKTKISMHNLNYRYASGNLILQDINLSFSKGQCTALVGTTGSGKSTLVNLILRFYDCPPNTIQIDGQDIRDFELDSLRSHIAWVGQDVSIINDTLRTNMTYGIERVVSPEEIENVLIKSQLKDFISRLPNGLETFVGDHGVLLSGGEKQRLAIARAMIKGAEILILDEATSALDSITEKAVQAAIREVMKGKTSIVIAHRLSTIKNADQIVVLDRGKIIERGAFNELLSKGEKFAALWNEQINRLNI